MAARIVRASEGIEEAVARLRAGELVAFPTETVYGLGANALDPAAVARIFTAKGRPATNPLIVHVADVASARALSSDWPSVADLLAARFWPGPLTLVVNKAANVPDIVTAGGPTVGVRVPAHPVALDLLRQAGVPIAAPSANRSEEVSPTTAQHVADSLGSFANDLLILDGGSTEVGIESTVLDVSVWPPRLLRLGMVTVPMLRELTGRIVPGHGPTDAPAAPRSPGLMTRHYAPTKPLLTVWPDRLDNVLRSGDGLWCLPAHTPAPLPQGVVAFAAPPHAGAFARRLYGKLRAMDAAPNIQRIIIERPPDGPEWAAIHDRLRRAAAPKESQENG